MTILCVDLDGTLIRTDTTWMATRLFLKSYPLRCWQLLVWLLHGRAYLKQQLAQKIQLDPVALPYHGELMHWLIERKQQGDWLVLATATDYAFAKTVADHLGIFSEIIASNGNQNLRANQKASALSAKFGKKGYRYVGNSYDDLVVWQEAKTAIVVNASKCIEALARQIAEVERVFE